MSGPALNRELMPRTKIDQVLAARDQALADIERGEGLIRKAMGDLHTFVRYVRHEVKVDRRDIDRQCWRFVLEQCGLATLMDEQQARQFDRELDAGPPEFVEANVVATFEQLYQDRNKIFARGVVNIFAQLHHGYSRHDPFRITQRIICSRIGDNWYRQWRPADGPHASYEGKLQLADLLRVLMLCSGRRIPQNLHQVIDVQHGHYEDEFMKVRVYWNNNGHVTIKDPKLVDQLNRLIADHFGPALAQREQEQPA